MEITVEQLLKGKSTTIKDTTFLSTSDYVKSFIDFMSKFTSHFIVDVKIPDQLTKSDDKDDITYNRVSIQAVLPKIIDDHKEIYGLIYTIDVKKPIYKIYKGYLHNSYNSLSIFDNSDIIIHELSHEKQIDYEEILKNLMSKTSNFSITINKLKNTFISNNKHELFGKIIDLLLITELNNIGGKVKLSPNVIITAFDNIYNNVSPFYKSSNEESSLYNLYLSITKLIKDDNKDMINKVEKTLLISNILNN